ncbi:MAG: hypothetical protein JKY98_06200 [Gammaproteobacteria bacterium]|nr:hypothetical protein [Gammaproteobacteria bacterium]
MQKRLNRLVVTAILILAILPITGTAQSISSAGSQSESTLTPWGDPNLQGVWDRRTITPLQRPAQFVGKPILTAEEILAYEKASAARPDGRPLDYGRVGITVHDPDDLDYGKEVLPTGQSSLIVDPPDGRIPTYTPAATEKRATRAKIRGRADSWLDRGLSERCITWGIPGGLLPQAYNNNILILQTPATVIIINEMIHDVRVVPMDGRPHIPSTIRQWHGDPRGHWEGDTLVVESTNFSAKASFRGASENLHLTERFTRIADNTLQYEFTVKDPSTWVEPWSVAFPMFRGDQPLYEFACHEGNYALANILRIARNLEKQAAQP